MMASIGCCRDVCSTPPWPLYHMSPLEEMLTQAVPVKAPPCALKHGFKVETYSRLCLLLKAFLFYYFKSMAVEWVHYNMKKLDVARAMSSLAALKHSHSLHRHLHINQCNHFTQSGRKCPNLWPLCALVRPSQR